MNETATERKRVSKIVKKSEQTREREKEEGWETHTHTNHNYQTKHKFY